jgi:hypothetical protein
MLSDLTNDIDMNIKDIEERIAEIEPKKGIGRGSQVSPLGNKEEGRVERRLRAYRLHNELLADLRAIIGLDVSVPRMLSDP